MPYNFNTAANYLTSYLPKRQRRAQDDEDQQLGMGAAFDLLGGQQQPQSQSKAHPSGSTNWRTQQQWEASNLPEGERSYTGPPGWSNLTAQDYATSAGGSWQKKRTFPQAGIYKGYGNQQMIQR